ncbi:MAG TPA: hypothetical protein VFQ00_02615 [Terriglobales bacterium]|nr:hypothetical protein [Terriglobales bacterium]
MTQVSPACTVTLPAARGTAIFCSQQPLQRWWRVRSNHKNFYVLGFPLGGVDVSSLGTNAAGLPVIQAQKGGYGNPFDERRVTQLAIRVTF